MTFSVSVGEPAVVGVRVTDMVHVLAAGSAGRLAGQVLVLTANPVPPGVNVGASIVSARPLVLVLVMVTVCGALVEFVYCCGNVSDAGETVYVGEGIVPDSDIPTVVGVPPLLITMTAVNGFAIVVVGVKVTVIEQLPAAGTPVHPLTVKANCGLPGVLLLASGRATVKSRAILPLLDTVTVCGVLVVFKVDVNDSAGGLAVNVPNGAYATAPISIAGALGLVCLLFPKKSNCGAIAAVGDPGGMAEPAGEPAVNWKLPSGTP